VEPAPAAPLFEELRDEAFLKSILLDPGQQAPVGTARKAIQAALALTIADDPAWLLERGQLTLLRRTWFCARAMRPRRSHCWTRRRGCRPDCGINGAPIV